MEVICSKNTRKFMKKALTLFLAFVLTAQMVLTNVTFAAQAETAGAGAKAAGANTMILDVDGENSDRPEVFTEVKLTAGKVGVNNETGEKWSLFKLDMLLAAEELAVDSDAGKKPFYLKFTFDSSQVSVPADGSLHGDFTDKADKVTYGTWSAKKDTDVPGKIVFEAKFNEKIYGRTGPEGSEEAIPCGEIFTFGILKVAGNGSTVNLGDGTNFDVEVTIDNNTAGNNPEDPRYELDKKGEALTDGKDTDGKDIYTGSILYTITAKGYNGAYDGDVMPDSSEAVLDERWIIDKIPDGLEIEEVYLRDEDGSKVKDLTINNDYYIKDNTVYYKIGGGAGPAPAALAAPVATVSDAVSYSPNKPAHVFSANGADAELIETAPSEETTKSEETKPGDITEPETSLSTGSGDVSGSTPDSTVQPTLPEETLPEEGKVDPDNEADPEAEATSSNALRTSLRVDAGTDPSVTDILCIKMKITNEYMEQKYITSSDEGDWKPVFKNTAYLAENADSATPEKPIAKSKEESVTPIFPKFFTKDGKDGGTEDGTISKKFHWKLDLQTHLSSVHSAYLIDWISDSEKVHEYDFTSGIKINGTTTLSNAVIVANDLPSITQLRNGDLSDAFLSAIASNEISTYSISEGTTKYQVWIIPVHSYINAPMTITYDTTVKQAGGEMYDDKKTLFNEAKFIYRKLNGTGDGSGDWVDSVTLKKNGEINYNILNKKVDAKDYDEVNQTIPWTFEINSINTADIKTIYLEDTLDYSKQRFLLENAKTSGITLTVPSGTNRTLTYIPPDKWDPVDKKNNGFTLVESPNKTSVTLKINIKDIPPTACSIKISTKVVDPLIINNQDKGTLSNSVRYDAWGTDGNSIFNGTKKEKTATCDIKHTLIQKSSIAVDSTSNSKYDYENNLIKWRVVVNPEHINIRYSSDDGTRNFLKDTMPEGVILKEFTKVQRVESPNLPTSTTPGDYIDAVISPDGRTFTFENFGTIEVTTADNKTTTKPILDKQEVNLKFTEKIESKDSFIFEFTTEVTDACRKYKFTSGKDRDKNISNLLNKAELFGYVFTDSTTDKPEAEITQPIAASASAKNDSKVYPSEKKGIYNPDSDTYKADYGLLPLVRWDVVINKTKAPIGGIKVSDTLESYMQLVTEGVTFCEGEVDPHTGAVVKKPNSEIDLKKFTDLSLTSGSLSFTIPEEFSKKTLMLSFDTAITGDTPTNQMRNHLSFEGAYPGDSTLEQETTNEAKFTMDDYIKTSTMIYIRLLKRSINSTGAGYNLPGAEFTVTEMTKSSVGAGGGTSADDWTEAQGIPKTRITNANGTANVMLMKRNKLYRIEETTAPEGYEISDKIGYCVFYGDDDTFRNFPDTIDGEKVEKISAPSNQTPGGVYHYTLDDKPEGSYGYSFVKLGDKDLAVKGAEFTAKPALNTLKSITAVSDENGSVAFTNLDKGTKYTITETKPPYGYRLNADSNKMIIQYSEDKKNFVLESIGGTEVQKDADGNVTVKNTPLTANVRLRKTDQHGNILTSAELPVSFLVTRKGIGDWKTKAFMAIHPAEDSSRNWETYTALPDVLLRADGWIHLDGLYYGDYRLTEVIPDHIKGTLADGAGSTVYVRIGADEGGEYALFSNDENFSEAKKSTSKETANGKDYYSAYAPAEGKQPVFSAVNHLKYAYVQLEKTAAAKQGNDFVDLGVPLAGAEFAIYLSETEAKSDTNRLLTLKTGADGTFDLKDEGMLLICDKDYWMKEINTPDSTKYVLDESVYQFRTGESQTTVTVSNEPNQKHFINKEIFGSFKLKKLGTQWQGGREGKLDTQPLGNVSFTLESSFTPKKTYNGVTGADGNLTFSNVQAGQYKLIEKTPEGYVKTNPIDVTVEENKDNQAADIINTQIAFFLKIKKVGSQGEPLDGVTFELRTDKNQKICNLVFDPLKKVYVLPEPTSETERYITWRKVTAENGAASEIQPALYYGDYKIAETATVNGYIRDEKEYVIPKDKIINEGTYIVSNDGTEDGFFENHMGAGTITIKKMKEVAGGTPDQVQAPGEGFRFRVTGTAFNGQKIQDYLEDVYITPSTGIERTEDGLLVTTDSTGTITLGRVLTGSYEITEIPSSNTGEDGAYVLDSKVEKILLSLDSGNKIEPVTVSFYNAFKRGAIEGMKTTSSGSGLGKAVIGLFPDHTSKENLTQSNLYLGMTAQSAEAAPLGSFRFKNVPYGSYLLAELTPPSGYSRNTNVAYRVRISEDGQQVTTGDLLEWNSGTRTWNQAANGSGIPIAIKNTPVSSGGGNGSGGPSGPVGPADNGPGPGNPPQTPTAPAEPAAPGQPEGEAPPAAPVVPTTPNPDGSTTVNVPKIPNVPPKSEVTIVNRESTVIYRGRPDDDGNINAILAPGDYTLVVIGDDGVPLAQMPFTIEDGDIPLGVLPKTGDHDFSSTLLIMLMLGAMAVFITLDTRRNSALLIRKDEIGRMSRKKRFNE